MWMLFFNAVALKLKNNIVRRGIHRRTLPTLAVMNLGLLSIFYLIWPAITYLIRALEMLKYNRLIKWRFNPHSSSSSWRFMKWIPVLDVAENQLNEETKETSDAEESLRENFKSIWTYLTPSKNENNNLAFSWIISGLWMMLVDIQVHPIFSALRQM